MRQDPFGFLFAAGLILGMSSLVSAGPIAGIARTDGQPLETGPFDSQPSAAGPEIAQITQEFQPMYLTSQPNTWTKTFRWEIPANTGLAPGATLSIMESIPLIYPADPAGTDPLVKLPIADWHESIVGGDPSQFVQWDTQSLDTNISARIGSEGFPINGRVNFSADGRAIWFNFDPISIPTRGALAGTPVTLDISKDVVWSGPVLDPIPFAQHLDILVSEYPTTPDVAGEYNQNGVVDAADYIVWRNGLGTTYAQADYDVWRAHFGQTAGSGAALRSAPPLSVAVPEPATTTLALMAFVVSAGFRCRGRRLHSRSQVPSRVLTWAAWLAIFFGGADTTRAFTTIYPGPPIVPFVGGFLRGTISGVNDAGTVIGVMRKVNDDRPYRWDGSGATPVALGQSSATGVVGIDNSGTAVGQTGDGSPPVYWPSSGTAPANLAIPAGWSGAAPNAINGTGTIVGFGGGASGLSAVRWTNSGATATELGTVAAFGANAAYYAYAVNVGGIAVGQVSYNPTPADIGSRPIRWDAAGTATQLGDLGTYPASNVFDNISNAYAINAAGTAVGKLLKNGGSALGYRAVRWDAGGTAATELGNLGTSSSGAATDGAWAINDAGTIAGRAEKYNLAGVLLGNRAVRWNSGQTAAIELGNLGTTLSGTTMTDIGSVRPINAAGTIVGTAKKYDPAGNLLGDRAVYWGTSAMAVDLNSLIDPAGGWVLTSVSAISDTGWIAGNGLFDPDGAGGQAAYDRMFLLQLPRLDGDYNGNGIVDAADYVLWRNNQGTTNVLPNDPIGGTIGTAQYNQWRSHFGQTAGSGAGTISNTAVPEPSILAMLIAGIPAMIYGRRMLVS